jgi:hypothetical protein
MLDMDDLGFGMPPEPQHPPNFIPAKPNFNQNCIFQDYSFSY